MDALVTTATENHTAARCSWCNAPIEADDDFVILREGQEHARCSHQRIDEGDLKDFLDEVARECLDKIRGYRDLHPSRAMEHRASAYLARLNAVVSAAVR